MTRSDTGDTDDTDDPIQVVVEDVSTWEGVETGPHRFNAVEFDVGAHEVGHIHRGGGALDINFPKRMGDALVAEGRTGEHHYVPESGWTTYRIGSAGDIKGARWLLRVSYLYRALIQRKKPDGKEVLEATDVAAELDELGVSDDVRAIFENVTELESHGAA
jgi:hypothetical protein